LTLKKGFVNFYFYSNGRHSMNRGQGMKLIFLRAIARERARGAPSLPACLCLAVLVLVSSGCSREGDYKPVDFSRTAPFEQPDTRPRRDQRLRVAVAAMISPKATFVHYRELLDYIGRRSGFEIELIQRKTYEEVNALFLAEGIDLAFICTGPFAAAREKYGFEALATPIVRGEPYYRAYLIVPADSAAGRLEDLRGRVFAFTDPDSNTGAKVPRFWLAEIGERPESFFSRTIFTYSHDNSILAVAKGLVDGASVDGHQWEYFARFQPELTARTRVVRRSQPFGSPPVVAAGRLDPDLRERLGRLLTAMHADPEGRAILEKLLIDRFAAPRAEWYASAREMQARLSDPGGGGHAAAKP
jgi:phosphonate transport system substrate-binding protein